MVKGLDHIEILAKDCLLYQETEGVYFRKFLDVLEYLMYSIRYLNGYHCETNGFSKYNNNLVIGKTWFSCT